MENLLTGSAHLFASANENFLNGRQRYGNCLRCARWSPDGTCLATNSEDHKIRLFNFPTLDWDSLGENTNVQRNMTPDLMFRESQIIYDFSWFPKMQSSDPATCFLLTASKGVPLHMWDAYSGKIHVSYRAMNAVDELATARCVGFTADGARIVAGYDKFVSVFDVSRPGTQCEYISELPTGIVSCTSIGTSMFALGTFGKLISLFDLKSNENIATVQGHRGGVTHLLLSPDERRLYSGARKDGEILCWDLRNYGDILHTIRRDCSNNQRLYFDVNFTQNILATGDSHGSIRIFDLNSDVEKIEKKEIETSSQFKAHLSSTNSVSIHPTLPILVSCSGERPLPVFDEHNEDSMFCTTLRQQKTDTKSEDDDDDDDDDDVLKFWAFK